MATLTWVCVVVFIIAGGACWEAVLAHRHRMRIAQELAETKAVNEVYEKLLASMAQLNEGMSGMRSVAYMSQQPEPGVAPGRSRIVLAFNDQADRIAVHDALRKIWLHWSPPKQNEVLGFGVTFDSPKSTDAPGFEIDASRRLSSSWPPLPDTWAPWKPSPDVNEYVHTIPDQDAPMRGDIQRAFD
jgi:hypothetical protein